MEGPAGYPSQPYAVERAATLTLPPLTQFPWHFDEANGVSSLGNIKWIDVSYVLQRIGYS